MIINSLKKNTLASLVSLASCGILLSSAAQANPVGGTVQAGTVNIQSVGPNTLQIDQFTQKAIIDWRSFSTNPQDIVRFLQPNASAVILNRVVGQDPSILLGQLLANGNVFLLNPNGIVFGPGSITNVGGLLASTLKMTNEDFLKGNYSLAQDPNFKLSSVVNQGTITITDGGYAVLAAPLVSNEGLIVANLGKVVMGAGEKMTLNFDGRNILNFRVDKLTGAPGTVLIGKDQLSSLLSQVITHPNLVEAGSITNNSDGTVSLGGASGTLVQAGQISTNGLQGQKAGTVVLDSGQVTVVGPSAVVEARGQGLNSAGGDVIVNSRGTTVTTAGSKLDTQGGISGNGGFIETSGKNAWLRGAVNPGKGGSYLLDPIDLNIVNGNGGSLDGLLPNPTGGGKLETISELALEALTAGSNITLQADNGIILQTITDGAITLSTNTSLNLEATGGAFFASRNSDAIVASGTGQIRVTTGTRADLPTLTATNDIHINAGGTVRVYGAVTSSAGTVNIVAGGDALTVTGFSDGYVGGNNASINATGVIEGTVFGEGTTPFFTRLNGQLSSSGSSTNIQNTGNVTVGNVGNLAGMVSGPLCFVNDGNLVINSTINSTVNSILQVTGNVDFTPLGNIVAADTVSLEVGGNTTDAGVLTDAAIIAPNFVLNTTGDVGSIAQPLITTVSNVAAQSTDGSIHLRNENSSNPLTLSQLSALKSGQIITGVNAGVNASIQATNDIVVANNLVAVGDAGLLANGNISFTAGNIQAGNTAVVAGRVLVGGAGVDVNATSAIIQGILSVGSQADPLQTAVGNLAGGSFAGNFFVNNTAPTLNMANVTSDLFGVGTVTELEVRFGSGIICLENTGNIVVAAPILSSGNVALRSGGEISITTGRVEAGDTVSLESVGNILDDNTPSIDVNATNFVAVSNTGSVGLASDGLEVSAANLSVQAPGTVVVNSISGDMTVANLSTLKGGASVIGVTAAGIVALDASAGALNVNSTVMGADIHLGSLNNTTIATPVSTKGQIEVVAGNITDTGTGSLSASEVILVATSNVGSNANPLDISARSLAGTSGGDYVVDQTGGLVVGNLTSFRTGTSFNGINAGGNVCIDVSPAGQGPSNLNISSPINATNSVALRVNGNPVVSADIQAGALVSAGNTISAEAANGTIENTGAGNVNFQGANVVLAARSVGASNAIQTNTTNLAARSSNGRVSIVDRGGNVTVSNLTTLKGAQAITGINSSSDVSLVGNNITVASRINASTNVALMSNNNTYFVGGSNITAPDTISLEAGGVVSGDNVGPLPGLGAAYTLSTNLVLDASGGVNSAGVGRLIVSAANIAGRSTTGDLLLIDRLTSSPIAVTNLTTLKGNQLISGLTAAGNIEFSQSFSAAQPLNLDSNVTAGQNVNLFPGSNLTFNGGIIQAGNTVVINRAATGQITSAPGNAVDINATNLVFLYFGNVGTAAHPLETSVSRLAGGALNAFIRNSSPTLDIASVNVTYASGFNLTVLGFENIDPSGLFSLQNTGNILVSTPVRYSEVALRSGGDIVFGVPGILGGTSFTRANTVSLEAAGSIVSNATDPNNLLVNATNFVALAGGNIGTSANAVLVSANNLSAQAGGLIVVNDTVGNLTITNLTTLQGGNLITGVNAGGNVCVDASGGSLNVNSTVNGANVHLGALTNVSVNANVNATNQLEVTATNGGISGGGQLQAQDLILASNTSIGSAATPFNVSAQNFAANSSSGDVYATASNSLTVANLTSFKSGNNYNGVSAAGNVCIDLPGGVLNVSGGISAGNTVALRARDGIQAGGLVSAGNTVSAESANGTIENTGAGNVNFQSANVVLAAKSVGASNAIQTNTTNLAARSSNGRTSIVDRGGNVTVSNLTTLKGAQAITGINSSSDVSLVGNNITVASSINASTNVALMSNNDTYLVTGSNISAPDTISFEAGGVVAGDAVSILGTAYTQSTNFVVDANGGVSRPNSSVLLVSASNIAARSTLGTVLLNDRGGPGMVTVANLTTLKGNQGISGVNALGDVQLSTRGLQLDSNVQAGQNVALFPGGNLTFNGGMVQAGNTVVILRPGSDQITSAPGAGLDINATSLSVTFGNIGTAANPLETSVSKITGGAKAAFIRNSSPTLDVTEVAIVTASGFNATRFGFDNDPSLGSGPFSLENTGNILVSSSIFHSDVALRSGGDIALQAGAIPGFTGPNNVSLEAAGSILSNSTNPNINQVNATNLVATAGGNIGTSTNVLLVSVDNIAARAGGSIVVNDTVGNLTISDLTTIQGGNLITGVNAGGNVCVDASGGSLNVNSTVSGANVHLGALTNVLVNANVNATTQLEVTATNGGISGGGQLQAQDLILASNTSIGSAATLFNVSAQNFAANSSSGDVYATASNSLTVANLTSFKSGTTYNGVSALGNVCLDLPNGVLNVSGAISAGNTVALRARDGIQAGGLVSAGNTISAESANGTIENSGAGNVNFQAANVVLSAQSVGASNAIQTNTTNLAAWSTNGRTSIVDRGGNVTVSNLTTLKGAQAITGINSSSDVSLVGGNVTVNSTVRAVTNAAVVAGGNLNFTNPGQIRAGDTVSLEVAGNVFKAVPGGDAVVSPNFVVNADGFVGSSLVNYLAISATNVAAQSTTDSVNLFNSNSTVVANLTTINGGTAISGLNAAVNVNLSTLGNTTFASNINAGGIAQVIGGNVNFVTGGIQAGNLAIVVGADIVGTSTSAIDIAAPNVLIAGDRVGSQSIPIETSAQNLAGRAFVGDFVVRNSSAALNVTSVTGIGGITAAGNLLCLDSTGSIVASNVIRSAGNVALLSGGDMVVNGTTIEAANTVSLESVGNIRDSANTNVDINATNLVAVSNTGSIGSSSDAIEVTVANIAARAAGSIAVNDTTGNLTVTDLTTLKGNVAVTGVNAGANVCVDASGGSLNVNSAASGANVHLGALNDVAMNTSANATSQLEVLATNGGISGAGQLQAQDLILASNTSIGSAATPFNVLAENFAANSSSGDVYATASNSLTVANLTSFKSGTTYNGVSALGNVCLDLPNGVLNVSGAISAGNTVALRARDGIQAGGLVSAGNTVSVESANGTIENTGAGNVNFQAANVVMAAQSIGASNAIQTNTTNLAAQSTNGRISIIDRGGNVTVSNLTTLKGAQAIGGLNASSDVALSANNINVAAPITAGSDVALNATGSIALNLTLGDSVVAANTISLEAGGRITDELQNPPLVNSTNLVISATGGVGALFQPVRFTAANVAAQSSAGNVHLRAYNFDLGQDVTVTNLTTLTGGNVVKGINASGDVSLDAQSVSIFSDSNITAGGDASLAGTNLNFTTGSLQAGNTGILSFFNVTSAPGAGVDVNATSLILATLFETGSQANPLETSVTNLAGRSTAGSLFVHNTAPTLNITTVSSGVFLDSATGLSVGGGSNLLCLDNTGNILLVAPVNSTGSVAIRASGDIALNSPGLQAAATVSLEAGGSILDANAGLDVNATNFVATAGGSIGQSGNPVEVSVSNVAAQAGGYIGINGTTGNLTITDLTTLKGGTPVSGVNAGGNVCVDASGGSLVVNSAVSGANVHLGALSDAAINANVNATTQLEVLAANGSISGVGALRSQDLILASNTSIGSSAAPLNVSAPNFAANSSSGDVYATASNSLTVANLTSFKNGTTFNGVSAAGSASVQSGGTLTLAGSVSAGNDVQLQATDNLAFTGGTVQTPSTAVLNATNILSAPSSATDVNATNLLVIGNTGTSNNPLQTTASNFAGQSAAGNLVVNSSNTNFVITNVTSALYTGTAVSGARAADLVCLEGAGTLQNAAPITAGNTVALRADNLVVSGALVSAGNLISVESPNGAIISNTFGQTNFQAPNVVLSAEDIGTNFGLAVNASNLGARATLGNINVVSTGANLATANLTLIKSGTLVQGLTASNAVCLDASNGSIQVNSPIVAGTDAALRSTGDISFSGGVQAGNTVSLQAGGGILDNNVATLDVNATNFVAIAGNDIGSNANPLDVAVTNIATRSGGSTAINAQSSNLIVTDLTPLKGEPGTVSGVNATGNASLQSSGALSLNSSVRAGNDIHLQAGGTLAFAGGTVQTPNTAVLNATNIVSAPGNGTDVNASNLLLIGNTGSPANPLQTTASNFAGQSTAGNLVVNSSNANFVITNVTSALYTGTAVSGAQAADLVCLEGAGTLQNAASITAGNTVALRAENLIVSGALVSAGNLISVESPNGAIISNTFGQTNFQAPNVVLSAEDIGTNFGLAVNASNLAARATLGNVNISSLSSNVSTANLTLVKSGTLVQGLTASNAVCLDASNGSIQINSPVSAGSDIALGSSGDLAINSTLTAANTVSLESGGSIRNQNAGVDVNAANAVATAAGNVDLDLNVTNFAARAANINATGVTNVASLNTLKGNTTVTGLNATTNVCVDAPAALNVNAAISGGNTVALRSVGNLNVNAPISAGSKISAESTAGNLQSTSNITQLSANDVALRAGDIGSAQPLTVQAQRLAAQATTGNVQLNLTSANTQTANLTLDKSGTLLQGVNANNGVCLDSLNGTLLINNPITAGNLIALRALNQIALNSTLTTSNTISLEAGGSIRNFGSGVDANAANLVATAGAALDLDLNVTNFAARANALNLTGLVNTATLRTLKGNVDVVGLNATTVATLQAPGAVNINSAINAGDRVALRSAGDINSNAVTTAGNRISFESTGGSIVDGNGNLVNLSATDIVLRANQNIGGSDAIETQASRLAAQAQLGSLMIANTSPTLQIASLSLEGSEGSISGLQAAVLACLTQTGSLNVVSASNASELSMLAGGDISIANNLTATNKLSLQSTGGSIASTVNDTNAHLTAPNMVLSAQANIGSVADPLLVNTNNLAARAQTGNLGIVDLTPGLNITSQVLSCSNLSVQGVSAQNQLRVGVVEGDMVVQGGSTISSGNFANITVANGNFFQNGIGVAIQSGGNAVVNTGCDFQVGNVGAPVAANVTGILTLNTGNATTIGQPADRLVVNTCRPMAPMAPGLPPASNPINPPAQDNVFLGEIKEYYPMMGFMYGLVEERPRYPLSMLVLAVIESGKTNYQLENFFPNTLMEAKDRQLEKPLTWGQGLDIPGRSTAFFVDPSQGYNYTQTMLENKVPLNWPSSLGAGSQSAFEQAVRDSLANDHLPSGIIENLIAQMRAQTGPFLLMRVPALPGVENGPVVLMLMPYKP